MDQKTKGALITFEGPEGGGKTTQIELLANHLKRRGLSVLSSREPGGTGIGISIRNILLDPQFHGLSDRTELFLFLADRAQHIREVIQPALAEGKIVLCDRFIDSTVAYQVGGRQFDADLIKVLNDFSSYKIRPDLTFLLDIDYDIGIRRATMIYSDRFENESKHFHQKIRETYLEIAKENLDRIEIIDTTRYHIGEVQRIIRQTVADRGLLKRFIEV